MTRASGSTTNGAIVNGNGAPSHRTGVTTALSEEIDGKKTPRTRYPDTPNRASSSQIPNLYDAETDGSAEEEAPNTYNTRSGMKRRSAYSASETIQHQGAGKVIVLKYQGVGNAMEPGPPAKRLRMSQLPEPIDVGADSTDGETASNA